MKSSQMIRIHTCRRNPTAYIQGWKAKLPYQLWNASDRCVNSRSRSPIESRGESTLSRRKQKRMKSWKHLPRRTKTNCMQLGSSLTNRKSKKLGTSNLRCFHRKIAYKFPAWPQQEDSSWSRRCIIQPCSSCLTANRSTMQIKWFSTRSRRCLFRNSREYLKERGIHS